MSGMPLRIDSPFKLRHRAPCLGSANQWTRMAVSSHDQLELGLDTFGDITLDANGRPKPPARVLRDVVAEAVLADSLGVDFIGVGEHHRGDFAISAPETLLAAIAGQTEPIRLGSAVTVL